MVIEFPKVVFCWFQITITFDVLFLGAFIRHPKHSNDVLKGEKTESASLNILCTSGKMTKCGNLNETQHAYTFNNLFSCHCWRLVDVEYMTS